MFIVNASTIWCYSLQLSRVASMNIPFNDHHWQARNCLHFFSLLRRPLRFIVLLLWLIITIVIIIYSSSSKSMMLKHPSSLGYQPLHNLSSSQTTVPYAASKISRNFMLALLMGMVFGFSFAYLLISVINWDNYSIYFNSGNFIDQHHHHDHDLDPHSHGILDFASGPNEKVSIHQHDEKFHKGSIT